MNDKTAIINAAQKFAAKGLIDKAISEWEKLLKDRNDGNIHNTIGDLYLKKGANQEAVYSFNKAADLFRRDGFYPKAIAIYKKVLNIAPNDTETLVALAKLNAERGLTSNAIDNYYRAAEIYNKEGSTEKAIMVVDKMISLSSNNVATRSKIAYLYFRLGLRERAANEYASIASYCLDENDLDKAKEFFDKSFEYDPNNIPALIGIGKLCLKNNDSPQAFEYISSALSHAPENKEVLTAYAKLALEIKRKDDAKKALSVLKRLDPSHIETKKLLGTLYIEEGLTQNAFDELLPVIDAALDSEKWSDAHEFLHHFRDLQTIPVRERLLRISKAQGDELTISSALKQLAVLHEKEGADEEALKLYREAFAIIPGGDTVTEKINELEIKLGIAHPSVNIEFDTEAYAPVEENSMEKPLQVEDGPATPVEFDREELNSPGDTAPDQHIPFEINMISESSDEEIHTGQPSQTMSKEEFAAKKAEADFYVEQGLTDEAALLYQSLLSAIPDNKEVAVRLASLTSAEEGTDNAHIKNIDEEPPLRNAVDDDLQELFAQFEKTEEKKVDYEANYVAALEFRRNGQLDEAVKELQTAVKDPDKFQRNSTMLALCYMEKRAYPLAIAEFTKILDTMTPDDSTYLHVKYELANAHMHNKELNRALELYFEIHELDPDFKDVADKMISLKGEATHPASPDREVKPKRDRVSYI